MDLSKGLERITIQAKLERNITKFWSITEMERTGGEPDVVDQDKKTGGYIFMIVQQKALQAAEVFVTKVKRFRQGKNSNQQIAL